MTEPTIVCPNCKTVIKLTESLAAPLVEATRKQFEEQIAQKDAEIAKREEAVREQQSSLAKAQASVDEQVAVKMQAERSAIAEQEAKRARFALATELDQNIRDIAGLQEVLKERDTKLAEAQQAQAELIRKQRELDDAKREMNLTIEKRVQESLTTVREQARKETAEELQLKVTEKELTITSMQKQIEELKRRASQGSQQLQGEAQELELESLLRARFPADTIERVPKGEHGGDVLHHVVSSTGQKCGTILWESKRTKNWSDAWLAKLREDQRAAKAEVAVIVSQVLPKDVESFDLVEGVWVTIPRSVLPIALMLRHSLTELAVARQAGEGQHTKVEMVYHYLTGPRFRQRVQAIVEAFSVMREDLDRERKAIMKQWAKREEQIERVMQATVGMYGDLQGIAGKSLQEIEGLDVRLLDSGAIESSGEEHGDE